MRKPAVSVILPFSKEENWLLESSNSLLQQTFTDFELLLTGNNTNDETLQLAKKISAGDKRIQLVEKEGHHLGQVLNSVIPLARGKYIARMDADDFALPDRLQRQFEHLENNPGIGLSAVATGPHPSAVTGEGFLNFMHWQNSLIHTEAHYQFRFVEATVAHPAVMMRREIFDAAGYYPEQGPEDFGLWLQWMNAGVRFEKIPEILLYWRDHADRLSRTGTAYAAEAFTQVKIQYAAPVILQHAGQRNIILCGAGKEAWAKKMRWEAAGIRFHGYSDLLQRNRDLPYYDPEKIGHDKNAYYISLLHGRGKAAEMQAFFQSRGLIPDADYLLAS